GVDLVRCLLADVTSVEDDEVGVFRPGGLGEARGSQRIRHTMRIVDVHLAAERLDVDFAGFAHALTRHARRCAKHPRLNPSTISETWTADTSDRGELRGDSAFRLKKIRRYPPSPPLARARGGVGASKASRRMRNPERIVRPSRAAAAARAGPPPSAAARRLPTVWS